MMRRYFAYLLCCFLGVISTSRFPLAESLWLEVDGIAGGQVFFDTETGRIGSVERRATTVVVPDTILDVPVLTLGSKAFASGNMLTDLTIPLSVTLIESGSIHMNEGMTLIYEGTAEAWASICEDGAVVGLELGNLVFLNLETDDSSGSWESEEDVFEDEFYEEEYFEEEYFEEEYFEDLNDDFADLDGFLDFVPESEVEQGGVFALPSSARLSVNGTIYDSVPVYTIEGATYFRLVDLAVMLQDTSARFEISYESQWNCINILSNRAYISDNGEMNPLLDGGAWAVPSSMSLYRDMVEVFVQTYVIDGRSYYNLDEMQDVLNFVLRWDDKTGEITLTTGSNTPSYLFAEQISDLSGGMRVDDYGNLGLVVQFDFVNQQDWPVYPYQELLVYASQGTWEQTSQPHYLPVGSISHETLQYENYYQAVAPNEMITLSFAFSLFNQEESLMIEVCSKNYLESGTTLYLPLHFVTPDVISDGEFVQNLEWLLETGRVYEDLYWRYQNDYFIDENEFRETVDKLRELFKTLVFARVSGEYSPMLESLSLACSHLDLYLDSLVSLVSHGAIMWEHQQSGMSLYGFDPVHLFFIQHLDACEAVIASYHGYSVG